MPVPDPFLKVDLKPLGAEQAPTLGKGDLLVSFLEQHRQGVVQLCGNNNWYICGGISEIIFNLVTDHFALQNNALILYGQSNSRGYALIGPEAKNTFLELSKVANQSFDQLSPHYDPQKVLATFDNMGFLTHQNYFFNSLLAGENESLGFEELLKEANRRKWVVPDNELSRSAYHVLYHLTHTLLENDLISREGIAGIKPGSLHKSGLLSVLGETEALIFIDFSSPQFHPNLPLIVCREPNNFCFEERLPTSHRIPYVPPDSLYNANSVERVAYRFNNQPPVLAGQLPFI
ncbi:MAG: hypothetical protein WD512_16670, partial [Candidatus Paceibacterota bacterium]